MCTGNGVSELSGSKTDPVVDLYNTGRSQRSRAVRPKVMVIPDERPHHHRYIPFVVRVAIYIKVSSQNV